MNAHAAALGLGNTQPTSRGGFPAAVPHLAAPAFTYSAPLKSLAKKASSLTQKVLGQGGQEKYVSLEEARKVSLKWATKKSVREVLHRLAILLKEVLLTNPKPHLSNQTLNISTSNLRARRNPTRRERRRPPRGIRRRTRRRRREGRGEEKVRPRN